MHISAEGKIGFWLAIIGLAGAGAIVIAPDHTWIGWALITVAIIGAAALSYYHVCERLGLSWNVGHKRQMTAIAGASIAGIGLGITGVYLLLGDSAVTKGDDLAANFRFPNPLQIGTSSLDVSYHFQNSSNRAIIISEFNLIEVFSKKVLFGRDATAPCQSPTLAWVQVFHNYNDVSMEMPSAMWDSDGQWMDDTSFVIIKSPASANPIIIESMASAVVPMVFSAKFPPMIGGDIGTVSLCPVIKTYDRTGHSITAICKGIAVAITTAFGSTSESLVTGPAPAGRILPASKSACQIVEAP